MNNCEDLIGRKFGRLTVVSRAENTKDGSSRWYCKCDCGSDKLVVATGTNLRAGHIKTCGCYTKLVDLTGQTFGRLTVIRRAENHKGSTMWLCRCTCGNEVIRSSGNLSHGKNQSCGCFSRERRQTRPRRCNSYSEKDGYVVGVTSSGDTFFIDKEDHEKIKGICWHTDAHGYLVGRVRGKKDILLHRYLMDNPVSMVVDHINHDKRDNRKSNLRIASVTQRWE